MFTHQIKTWGSNSVLASMLGINNKRKISDIIHSARHVLVKCFVPHYISLAHITQQEVINKQTSSIAAWVLTENRKPCILILGETYLYIQMS